MDHDALESLGRSQEARRMLDFGPIDRSIVDHALSSSHSSLMVGSVRERLNRRFLISRPIPAAPWAGRAPGLTPRETRSNPACAYTAEARHYTHVTQNPPPPFFGPAGVRSYEKREPQGNRSFSASSLPSTRSVRSSRFEQSFITPAV